MLHENKSIGGQVAVQLLYQSIYPTHQTSMIFHHITTSVPIQLSLGSRQRATRPRPPVIFADGKSHNLNISKNNAHHDRVLKVPSFLPKKKHARVASFTNIQTQQQVLNYCRYVLASPVFTLVLSICSICSISQDVNESWRVNRSPASPLRHRRSRWPLVPGRVKDLEVQWANRIVEYTVQSKSKTYHLTKLWSPTFQCNVTQNLTKPPCRSHLSLCLHVL